MERLRGMKVSELKKEIVRLELELNELKKQTKNNAKEKQRDRKDG